MRCDKPKIIESLKHYTVVQASCGKAHTLLLTGLVHQYICFIHLSFRHYILIKISVKMQEVPVKNAEFQYSVFSVFDCPTDR